MDINLLGGHYDASEKEVDRFAHRQTINWVPITFDKEDQKSQFTLKPRTGLTVFANAGGNKVKALKEHNGRVFAVVDNIFYEIDSTGALTNRGTIANPQDEIALEAGGDYGAEYIRICNGLNSYTYSYSASSIVAINSPGFIGAEFGSFMDGYFIGTFNGTMQWSSLNNPTSYNGLDVLNPGYRSRKLLRVCVANQELHLMCDREVLIYYNDGVTPFAQRTQTIVNFGLAAKYAVEEDIQGGLVWLATTRAGYRTVVFKSSNELVEIASASTKRYLSSLEDVQDAYMYAISEHGQSLICLTLPSEETTLVYSFNTGLWHKRICRARADHVDGTPRYEHYWPRCATNAFGKVLVGDSLSGRIYYLDEDAVTDDGHKIKKELMTKTFDLERKYISLHSLRIDYASGVDNVEPYPVMELAISYDGGLIFNKPRIALLGNEGNYASSLKYHSLGRSRDLTLRFTTYENIELAKATARGSYGSR